MEEKGSLEFTVNLSLANDKIAVVAALVCFIRLTLCYLESSKEALAHTKHRDRRRKTFIPH